MIKPEKRKELIADLEARTGINIHRIEIGRIDFLKDSARINIYYFQANNRVNMADDENGYISDI